MPTALSKNGRARTKTRQNTIILGGTQPIGEDSKPCKTPSFALVHDRLVKTRRFDIGKNANDSPHPLDPIEQPYKTPRTIKLWCYRGVSGVHNWAPMVQREASLLMAARLIDVAFPARGEGEDDPVAPYLQQDTLGPLPLFDC